MNLRQDINLKDFLSNLGEALSALKLSVTETIFLLAALGFAFYVSFFYVTRVQPQHSRLAELRAAQQALLQKSADEKKRLAELEKQRANAESILDSLSRFESYLRSGLTGKAAIIDEFEGLAAKHRIVTGDLAFKPIVAEPLVDENGQPLKETIRSDSLNVYPALSLDTAVIGDYPNLRRFLADLEKSRQFLIVNAVTFQGEADKNKLVAAASKGRAPQLADPNSIPVTLKLEMETYFQRQ